MVCLGTNGNVQISHAISDLVAFAENEKQQYLRELANQAEKDVEKFKGFRALYGDLEELESISDRIGYLAAQLNNKINDENKVESFEELKPLQKDLVGFINRSASISVLVDTDRELFRSHEDSPQP